MQGLQVSDQPTGSAADTTQLIRPVCVQMHRHRARAGTGGSSLPDLKAEFNDLPHERGTLSMARAQNPDSANSQFFICFKAAPFLDRQYTVFGKVVEGMELVDKIKKGDSNNNGSVNDPDKIISFKSL